MQAPRRCGVRDRVEVLAPAAVALTGLVFVVLYSVALTSVSGASRRATPREWEAIKAAAMRGCRKEQPVPADYGTCRWRGRELPGRQRDRSPGAYEFGCPPPKRCGHAGADYLDGEGGAAVDITGADNISCRRARRIVKRCIQHRTVRGWRPALGDRADTTSSSTDDHDDRDRRRMT